MEFWYKNTSKGSYITFIFQNKKKRKKNEKIQMNSKKSINSFEMKKKMQILWGLALYFLITCIGTE